jgi:hypothetical protein
MPDHNPKLADLILISAKSLSARTGSDPRTIERRLEPIATLATPQGVRNLYDLANSLLELSKLKQKK